MVVLLPVLLFALLLALEEIAPGCRSPRIDWRRMGTNWGLGLANWALAALMPIGALAASLASHSPLLSSLPIAAGLVLLITARSLAAYWIHRAGHGWRWLWHFHRLHHADREVDVTTGLRNHPVEALIAAATAAAVVAALGASPAQTIAADAVLFSAALWHHAAIRLPRGWSRTIERVLVTPRYHRLHHSSRTEDHDSNFGDLLTLWDRAFGTYRQPRRGAFAFGLGQDLRETRLAAR